VLVLAQVRVDALQYGNKNGGRCGMYVFVCMGTVRYWYASVCINVVSKHNGQVVDLGRGPVEKIRLVVDVGVVLRVVGQHVVLLQCGEWNVREFFRNNDNMK
jgi:hypothetical protein